MKEKEKWLRYASILSQKVGELFDDDSYSDLKIDKDELLDDDNLTQFFHALANAMPANVYNKFTGDDKNYLQFNHLANQLVFQYSKKKD